MPHQAYKRYWISYDIASEHLWQKVSQLLTGWVAISPLACSPGGKPEEGQIVILQCAAPGRPGHPLLGRPHDHQHNYWIG